MLVSANVCGGVFGRVFDIFPEMLFSEAAPTQRIELIERICMYVCVCVCVCMCVSKMMQVTILSYFYESILCRCVRVYE